MFSPFGGRRRVFGKKKHTFTPRQYNVAYAAAQGSVISPEALPHVFDRFYRGNKSRGSAQGHGLGLAIVRQLTENLGGSITVRSSEAEGTVFLVVLPGQETPQAQI